MEKKKKKPPKGCYKITPHQLACIIMITDDISSMSGVGGEADDDWGKAVKAIDRMLKSNGLKRRFK